MRSCLPRAAPIPVYNSSTHVNCLVFPDQTKQYPQRTTSCFRSSDSNTGGRSRNLLFNAMILINAMHVAGVGSHTKQHVLPTPCFLAGILQRSMGFRFSKSDTNLRLLAAPLPSCRLCPACTSTVPQHPTKPRRPFRCRPQGPCAATASATPGCP